MLVADLTGSKDGTVRLWEWGHMECINEPRKPGAFPKVTKVLFNAQGNKVLPCAVCYWSDLYILLMITDVSYRQRNLM